MKCRRCGDSEFVIRTNPEGRCFDYLSGIKKKVEEFDTTEAGTLGVIDTDFGNGIFSSSDVGVSVNENDDIAQMEKQNEDIRRANGKMNAIRQSLDFQSTHMMDDHASNSKLRASFRSERKAKKQRLAKAVSVGLGRGIEISDEHKLDALHATRAFDDAFDVQHKKVIKREKNAFGRMRKGSIFSKNRSSTRNNRKGDASVKVKRENNVGTHSTLSIQPVETYSSNIIKARNEQKHIELEKVVHLGSKEINF